MFNMFYYSAHDVCFELVSILDLVGFSRYTQSWHSYFVLD